jgi:hypothetical protein
VKPRPEPVAYTDEDMAVWAHVMQRQYRYGLLLWERSVAFDRRDYLIMLARGVHCAQAAVGLVLYWKPAHYWVSADGSVSFEPRMAYTADLPYPTSHKRH